MMMVCSSRDTHSVGGQPVPRCFVLHKNGAVQTNHAAHPVYLTHTLLIQCQTVVWLWISANTAPSCKQLLSEVFSLPHLVIRIHVGRKENISSGLSYVFTPETPAGVSLCPELNSQLCSCVSVLHNNLKIRRTVSCEDYMICMFQIPEPWLQSDVAEGMTASAGSIPRFAPSLHLLTFNEHQMRRKHSSVGLQRARSALLWYVMHEEESERSSPRCHATFS